MKNFLYGWIACGILVAAHENQWGGVIFLCALAVINGLIWAGHREE